jgi:hypothetical protein
MFLFSSFLFCKIGEPEGRTGPAWGRVGTSGKGEVTRKGNRRLNTIQKMCTLACKCNNDTCCNCSLNQGRKDKESCGGGEFKYDIVDCKDLCKFHSMPTHPAQQ